MYTPSFDVKILVEKVCIICGYLRYLSFAFSFCGTFWVIDCVELLFWTFVFSEGKKRLSSENEDKTSIQERKRPKLEETGSAAAAQKQLKVTYEFEIECNDKWQ